MARGRVSAAGGILAGSLLLSGPALGSESAALTLETALARLAERLESERARRHLPSLSVAVVHGDRLVMERALGLADLDAETPATPDHVYRAGSITKVLVATALMQLVERGVLRLDDPLAAHLPEYRPRVPWPDTPPTTLRQLASHTSGLPRDAAVNFWMNHSIGAWTTSGGQAPIRWYVSKERLLETLSTVELETPPDGEPVYSNLGMSLLAIAVERAAGQPFPDYVAEHVLRPLGMNDSRIATDAGAFARMPVGYVFLSPEEPPLIAPPWQLGAAAYTGGLVATPADLARLLVAQFPTPDGRRSAILGQPGLRQMHARTNGSDAGLGWWTTDLDGRKLIGHTGGHFGFLASVAALPAERLGIAVMTNTWNPMRGTNDTWEIAKLALADLAPAVAQPAPVRPAPPAGGSAFDPAKVALASYVGRYGLPGGFAHVDVELRDGKLWQSVREAGPPATPCEPIAADRFSCGLEFRRDASGRLTGLSLALFDFRREP